jgi:hypothetical protein
MRKRLLAGLLTAAALAGVAPAALSDRDGFAAPAVVGARSKEPEPLLGIVRRVQADGREWSELVRVDTESLQPDAGRGLPISRSGPYSWTFSPDRSRLALTPLFEARRGTASSLRVVDVGPLRRELELPLGYGLVPVVWWLEADRILAVQIGFHPERLELVVVAPSARRVLSRVPLDGQLMAAERTPEALVLLLAPKNRIGPGALVVASAAGAVRFVGLDRVWIGNEPPDAYAQEPVAKWRRAGFAVDPDGRRAYVFPAGSDAAEIDLRTLDVSYHSLAEPVSLLGRLRDFFDPAAQAKAIEGPTRAARWLGGGLVAVSGMDYATWRDSESRLQMRSTPAGLALVDTRSWRARTIDRGASAASFAEGLLLATGSACELEGDRCTGMGLAAYGLDGERRFRLFEGKSVWVWPVFRGRAYVGGMGEGEPMRVVELASGRIVGERREPLPWLLLGDASVFGG